MAKLPIPFGNPNTYAGHSGVDYPVPRGSVIRASGSGTVVTRARNDAGGFFVFVKYDAIAPAVGYHHMDSHNGVPPVGTRVQEGSQLGFVGSLGARSTGPHLHSEVAGHRTTAGYWQFFDRNRVVGSAGSAAGGSGSRPAATKPESSKTPERKRKKMDDLILLVTKDNQGGIRRYLIDARLEAHREISQYKYDAYKNTGTPEIFGFQPVDKLGEWPNKF